MTNSDRSDMFIDAENTLRFDGQYRGDAISFIVTRTVGEDQQVSFRAFFKFKSNEDREWTSFNKIENPTDLVAVADYALSGNATRPEIDNLNFTHVPDWAKIIPTIHWHEDLVILDSGGGYWAIRPTRYETHEYGRGDTFQYPTAYGVFDWKQENGAWSLRMDEIDRQSSMEQATHLDPDIQLLTGRNRWLNEYGRVGNEWLPRCRHYSYVLTGDVLIVSNNGGVEEHPSVEDRLEDGTELHCVGFREYTVECDFGNISPKTPRGVYSHKGAPLFRKAGDDTNSEPFTYPYAHLVTRAPYSSSDFGGPLQERLNSAQWKAEKEPVRIGDIPEREFVVGDWVSFKDNSRIESNYHHTEIVSFDGDADGKNLFGVRVALIDSEGKVQPAYGRSFVRVDELELVARGNYYWWLHDKQKIHFESLEEEAAFYAGLGECVQIRHPVTGLYDPFTLDEKELALDMIRRGEIAVLRKTASGVTGWRYPNLPDLEKRLRKETLTGFGVKE